MRLPLRGNPPNMNEEFNNWLLATLDEQGWTATELARRAGLSLGALSNILNGYRRPGADICVAVAQALNVRPEMVLRLAGILPKSKVDETELNKIIEVIRYLDASEREEVFEYARWRLEQQNKKKPRD